MKKNIYLLIVCFFLGSGVSFGSVVSQFQSNVKWQTVVWKHIPLNITLPVGYERIIHVPNSAKIGIPVSIANKLAIQRFNGWFYITAKQSFSPVSVQIRDNVSGQTVLLSLSATQSAPSTAINIIYAKSISSQSNSVDSHSGSSALKGSMALKTLTQYAERQLYSPKRLLSNPYHIQLVKSFASSNGYVPKSEWSYGLFVDGSVVGLPWAEWLGGGYYVTAVIIKNLLPIDINLTHNLVNLCGRQDSLWSSVTFFPYQKNHIWKLASRGHAFDSTVAFLVSRNPFNQTIKSCEG